MKLNRSNIIDIATITVVLLLVVIGAVYYLHKPTAESTKLRVTVEIADPAQVSAVLDSASSSKRVYLNSIDVQLDSGATMVGNTLLVELTGSGHTDTSGYYVFNGQRLLIGQKAEIHGAYFAQGKIVKIENAN